MVRKLTYSIFLLFLFHTLTFSKTIAISYFDNTSGDVKYNALSKGITDMLITDLSKVQGLTIVEREKLEKLIGEIKLGQSKYIDPKTAQQLGKGLGAEAILTGAFIIMGNQIRIDARLIDVETSTVIMAEEVTGPTSNFFQMHSALVKLLASNLKLTQQQTAVLNVGYQPVSLATVVDYSEAIDNFDLGLEEEALKSLEKTVKDNPGFLMAIDKLKKVRENLIIIDKKREELLTQKIEVILNSINIASENWATEISNSWAVLMSSYSYDAMLDFNARLLEKGIDPEKRMYGESMDIRFGEMLEMYNITAFFQLKRHEEVINHGQAFLAKYPISMYYASVRMSVEQSLAELEAREAGNKAIDKAIQNQAFLAYVYYIIQFGNYKTNLSPEELTNFVSIMKNQIIDYLKNYGAINDDFDAIDFQYMVDASIEFNHPEFATELLEIAHKIMDGTEEEEAAFTMDESFEKYQQEKDENAATLANYKEKYETAGSEGLPTLLTHGFQIISSGGYDLAVEIAEKYLKSSDTRDSDNVARSRMQAWDNLFETSEKLNDIKSYETLISRYKQDNYIQKHDKEWYTNELKSYEKELRNMQTERREYIREFTTMNPEKDILIRYANACRDNKQYIREIKFRKQLIQNYSLTKDEKELNYYFLVFAYQNLGKYDEARIYGKRLMDELPDSDYASSIKGLLDFMPR